MSIPPPATSTTSADVALEHLLATPQHFSFDAAMAVLEQVAGNRPLSDVIRFHTPAGLATPTSDIVSVDALPDGTFRVVTGFGGLTGHDGVLPRPYGALVDEQHRARSNALSAFLDMLAQRPRVQFAEAGTKYTARSIAGSDTLENSERPIAHALFALMGFTSRNEALRAGINPSYLLYFSGLIATRPRSAERLRTLLEEWTGAPVTINQFSGHWTGVPADQQSRLPGAGAGQFCQLGIDTVIGAKMWDMNARIEIRIGPLSLASYRSFLPQGSCHELLTCLVRTFIDDDVECVVRLGLKQAEIPPLQHDAIRLGADSWLPQPSNRFTDAFDAIIPVAQRV
ncbi:hypothetical protein AA101099_0106 [Neoasaia chiangmaiensis NBRC 101099]|uniref:Uncharacterized protein n=1 Tax=Neoasaia chiangmaiensis TaxID=320497 RepID=A0A1U9KLQ0_9PROT|nr:type VI secretion system baseplate subunit TssG [Neoasaia chiangmaiensis]AQS86724.1 hypothetical protein A0U93_00785 [Neoasaia chiangmaiensis]GBR35662.1 hypothetical protein AA101099_0106 [Neoasaia chiangmaiensis NBRC 101099]GEN16425.1 type VI secretion system protein [Neoasaia chiangmaiensis]